MKRKIIVSLIIVFALIICFVGGVMLNGHYFKSSDDIRDYDNNGWMSCIKDDTLITDIVMPGSHDAGSCSINWLGRTQGYSIAEQLSMGARYFDLRVNKTDDGYYLYHEMFDGEEFTSALSAIRDFIKANTSELLILDFQHFKGGSERDVVRMLEQTLVSDGTAVKSTSDSSELEFISSLTIGEARGKCVILFGGNENIVSNYDYIFGRNNDDCTKSGKALDSCYISEYNKMKSEDFVETALPYYYQRIKEKISDEGYKGLFVLQGQLTDGKLIFGPYSKEKAHDERMNKYIAGIKEDADRLALTNIIMRDFLTTEKCEQIILLNHCKGNTAGDFEFEK